MLHRTKKLTICAALIIYTLLLTHCGPESDAAPPAELAPATVHWLTWDRQSAAEIHLTDRFRETYPQIDFKREEQNGNLDALLAAEPAPDLLNIDVAVEYRNAARQGQLADLTEIWTESGLFDAVPASISAASAIDGKQFYLPVAFGWTEIYYNKAIFDQYNLQPPQTWDEFLDICETLLINGETPIVIGGADEYAAILWFEYLNVRINGPAFQRELMAGGVPYDDPRVRNVLEVWRSLFANGYTLAEPQNIGGLQTLTTIIRGDKGLLGDRKAVMALANTYDFAELPQMFMDELDSFRFPIIDAALPVAEIIDPFGYAVPVGAEQAAAALNFLKESSTPEGQTLVAQYSMFQSSRYAPVRTDVDMSKLSSFQRGAQELATAADEIVLSPWNAMPRQMFGMVGYYVTRFVNGPQDVDLFLARFEEARQKMLAQGVLTPDREECCVASDK
jgi:ABC-type glycerol-3-phosphate transport system substrate-binding protein